MGTFVSVLTRVFGVGDAWLPQCDIGTFVSVLTHALSHINSGVASPAILIMNYKSGDL